MDPQERVTRLRAFRRVLVPFVAAYLGYAFYLGSETAVVSNLVALGFFGVSYLLDRFGNYSAASAQSVLVGSLVALVGASLGDNLIYGAGIWHLPLLSLGAGFVLGVRAAIGWAIVAALSVVAVGYAHTHVELPREYPYTEINVVAMRLFGLVFASVFGYLLSQSARKRLLTQRRQTAGIQQATQQAAAASEAKTAFLAQVSHELRTPMNGILGMTQYLRARERLAPAARAHVETIHRCSRRLLGLFSEILDLSRVESGGWSVQHEPFDLVAVLIEISELFSARGVEGARGLRVNADRDAFWMWGDATRLRQVLSNLVGNAVKFCEQGEIEVGLGIEALPRAKGSHTHRVSIFVKDEGVGMSETQEQSLFSEFGQRTAHDGAVREGTGLGLMISRQLVEKMGGNLEVSTELEQGSTFTISLEVRACLEDERPREDDRDSVVSRSVVDMTRPSSGLCVLVVDDLVINRRVAKLALEGLGCEVHEAQDGVEAVAKAQEVRFDVIFMDLRMPNLDGFGATKQIMASGGCNATTPIVALSASAFLEDKAECKAAGMLTHLAKPFRVSDLANVLETVVSGVTGDVGGSNAA